MSRWMKLKLYMRVLGAVEASAIVPALMPIAWIAVIHQWLGMGPFPDAPVAQYLARSTSWFYVIQGGLFWLLSFDPPRYRPVIAYLGVAGLLGGVGLLAMDWMIGMPVWWTLMEGPVVMGLCLTLLVLLRRSSVAEPAEHRPGASLVVKE